MVHPPTLPPALPAEQMLEASGASSCCPCVIYSTLVFVSKIFKSKRNNWKPEFHFRSLEFRWSFMAMRLLFHRFHFDFSLCFRFTFRSFRTAKSVLLRLSLCSCKTWMVKQHVKDIIHASCWKTERSNKSTSPWSFIRFFLHGSKFQTAFMAAVDSFSTLDDFIPFLIGPWYSFSPWYYLRLNGISSIKNEQSCISEFFSSKAERHSFRAVFLTTRAQTLRNKWQALTKRSWK